MINMSNEKKTRHLRYILIICGWCCLFGLVIWGLSACGEKNSPPQPPQEANEPEIAAIDEQEAAVSSDFFKFGSSSSTAAAFLYLGDSQSNPDDGIYDYDRFASLLETAVQVFWQELSEDAQEGRNQEAEKEAASPKKREILVVIGGDLINEESDEQEWEAFSQAVKTAQKHTNSTLKIMPVSGNHTSGGSPYTKRFKLPDNGPPGAKGLFYSFDYGNVRFLMTDSNLMGSLDEQVVKQLQQWAEQVLSQSEQTWNIVVTHHPLFPVGINGKDALRAETMRQNYLPVYEKYQVDLILCGHQHVFARTKPMSSGIVQLMGVSGGKYYLAGDSDAVEVKAENCSVFSIIRCDENKLSVVTRDENSQIIDTYEKSR